MTRLEYSIAYYSLSCQNNGRGGRLATRRSAQPQLSVRGSQKVRLAKLARWELSCSKHLVFRSPPHPAAFPTHFPHFCCAQLYSWPDYNDGFSCNRNGQKIRVSVNSPDLFCGRAHTISGARKNRLSHGSQGKKAEKYARILCYSTVGFSEVVQYTKPVLGQRFGAEFAKNAFLAGCVYTYEIVSFVHYFFMDFSDSAPLIQFLAPNQGLWSSPVRDTYRPTETSLANFSDSLGSEV